MTENSPTPGGDGPESGTGYPPHPNGPGGPASGPTPGQFDPRSGAQYGPPSGSQYGQAPGSEYGPYGQPPGGQYGQPPGDQYGPPASVGPPGGQYGPPGGQYGPPGSQHEYGPPGGGYGPPPGYGSPGGGYQPPGYAGAPPYAGGGFAPPPVFSIGDALSYGWTRFSKNALNWILLLLAIFAAFAVVGGLLFALLLLPSTASSSDSTLTVSFFSIGMVVFVLAILALAFLSSVVTTQGGFREVDGAKPAFGDFFRFQNLGGALLAAVLVGVLTWVGSLLCYLPGLVVAFFGMFTVAFAIDRGMNAWTALQSSFSLVSANIGPVFLLYLAMAALNWVGSLLLGLGLLVTVPMTAIALMFAYRRLTGGPIAPL